MPNVVTGNTPNLVNGISQQAASLRLPSQGEASENFYPTIVDGLVKRPPTQHLASLGIEVPAGSFTHFIIRDDTEQYICVITPAGAIRVWDLDGVEKTVTNTGAAYLAGLTDPSTELRAITVADYTFIVNKTRVVQAGTTTSPTRPYEALVEVRTGNYGKTYNIFIDGANRASYATPDGGSASHSAYIDTTYIASQLYTQLVANGFNTAPWAVGRYNSTIYIRNTSANFAIYTEDGYSGRAMKEVKDSVAKFDDLPQHGPLDVVLKVAGEGNSSTDDYYVKFNKTNYLNGFGEWKECPKPGIVVDLNPATMPHTLRREADGTFSFGPETWDPRGCGDLDSCPNPSFVGQTIKDVFFHRNRLGMLTGENFVFSQAGEFFSFFRTTMLSVLDTDPIDGAASHIKVSLLKHAVPYSEVLILFSDQTQFRLEGNDLLTPKTVNAKPISELAVNEYVRPVPSGNSIFFVSEGTSWAALYEYFIDKNVQSADDDNVSAHVPSFIPSGVDRLIASPELDLVIVHSLADPAALYLYKYHWNGQEKLQSAWVRWSFPGATRVDDIAFNRKLINVLVTRSGKTYIEQIDAEQGVVDAGSAYTTYLDRRWAKTGATAAYNSTTDETTFTLPYPAAGTLAVTTVGGTLPEGVQADVAGYSLNTIRLKGDWRSEVLYFGTEYPSSYTFSQFFYRGQDGKIAQLDGRLQVLGAAINYAKSAYFKVEVTNEGRPVREYVFTGRIIGDSSNLTGAMAIDSGRLSIPVMSRNDRTKITVVNDTWRPSSFTSANWRGTWNPLSREL